jgi:hypothetical protein
MKPIGKRSRGSWQSEVAAQEWRIAWLLPLLAKDAGFLVKNAHLQVAAEAGFRVVALPSGLPMGTLEPAMQAQATRLGMRCIVVSLAEHHRLGAQMSELERRTQAQALSRAGFAGFILCDSVDNRPQAEGLLATAQALLRSVDQIDWESFH